ncbi:Shwachman-Bodian-diamond syndrome protein-domain-containing protein [Mycena floridula]|nr:Shwachman-Bodian-diamond syndrome protein-domain-containing protein [Mycena floridula]
MVIQQPSNQIKLTNVSIVRLKKGGKRFEIACYKNKVQEWRTGVETSIDDVLQISSVFVNVSKGEVAKNGDLQKAFGTTDVPKVVEEILKKGEVQVGEKERDHDLSALRKEIATLIAAKCVDPSTQRAYPVGLIEKAMAEAGVSVKQNKTAKSQVSECIKLLQTDSQLPIQRARMRIRITMPNSDGKRLREKVIEGAETIEDDEMGQEEWEVVRPAYFSLLHLSDAFQIMQIDPGQFRIINDLLQKECKGRWRIDTMNLATTVTGTE